ncbi:ABC transporter permease [Rothia nasimurium]|uniref:ABC transporter permease n=1 Tax=Rothia nasimurium TaxID=85336 RepID=UPI001F41C612|nr:ABC transporter permease [Rothia nasimurium]
MATTLGTVAFSNLGKHRLRFALTSIGIAISAFFLTAVLLLNSSMDATLRAGSEPAYSKADFVVSPVGVFNNDYSLAQSVPLELEKTLEGIEAVSGLWAQFTVYAPTVINNEAGRSTRHYLARADLPPSADLFPFELEEGAYPTDSSQVLVPSPLATEYGLTPGSTIDLTDFKQIRDDNLYQIDTQPLRSYTVSGIYKVSPFTAETASPIFTLASPLDGDSVRSYQNSLIAYFGGNEKSEATQILLTVQGDPAQAQAQLEQALAPYPSVLLATPDQQVQQEVGHRMGSASNLVVALLTFWLLALGLSTFIIANTFRVHAAARARELALLRVLGASQGSLVRMLLLEAALLGATASLIGVATAYLVGYLFRLAPTTDLIIEPTAFAGLTAIAVCTLTTLLGALLPALRTRSLSPVAALSPQGQGLEPSRLSRLPLYAGLAFLLSAGLALLLGGGHYVSYIVATVLFSIGLICLFPLAPYLLAQALTRWGSPYSSLHLAASSIRQSPTQAATVGRIIFTCTAILAALLTGTSTVQESVLTEMKKYQSFGVDAPVQLRQLTEATSLQDQLLALPQVKAATVTFPQATAPATIPDMPDVTLYSADLDQLAGALLTPQELGDLDSALVVSEAIATNSGWKDGDTVTVTGSQGHKDLTVKVLPFTYTWALIPYAVGQDISGTSSTAPGDSSVEGRIILSTVDQTSDEQEASLLTTLEDITGTGSSGFSGFLAQKQSLKSDMTALLAVVLGLLSLALLISLVGIANTQILSAYQRRRPYALLRAAGMSTRALRKTISLETTLIASTAVLLGLAGGICSGVLLMQSFEGVNLVYAINGIGLALVAGGGLFLSWFTAFLPAVRASRYSPVKALAETT